MTDRTPDSPPPIQAALPQPDATTATTANRPRRERPDFSHEAALIARGARLVAGVDEVGRGPLAGPVVAAAVAFDHPDDVPDGINDSKQLSAKVRSRLYEEILAVAHVAIASVSPHQIDRMNIRQASLWAMTQSLHHLDVRPTHVLFDGRDVPEAYQSIGTGIVKGDTISLSIAAASIVAKVVRDRTMDQADKAYPGYGFGSNKGYGSAKHLAALRDIGPTSLHRMSFRPLSLLQR